MKQIALKLGILGLVAAGFASASSICPNVGSATDCGVLITITDDGSGGLNFGVTVPTASGNPYDGADDTMIGVLNSTAGTTIDSISLSSSTDIFGLDNDGMCFSIGAAGAIGTNSCSASDVLGNDPGDYSGDAVSFTYSLAAPDSGIVTFIGGLAPGDSQFFSLEENIVGAVGDGGSFTAGSASPEPGTIALLGIGIGLVFFGRRRLSA